MITIEKLRKDYETSQVLYTDFLKEISDQLKTILENQGIMKIAEISQRVKAFDSIEQNISNYKFDPKIPEHLGLIRDLAGIRIALLFKRYINQICSSIETNFEIREKKHIFHNDDQFGYESKGFALNENMSSILDDLFLFEIKTVKDFRNLLNKQKAKVLEHQEIGFKLMENIEPNIRSQLMNFSIQGIIRKMLDYEFSKKDGFEFFEKISRLPAGTMEKLISTIGEKR